MKLKSTLFILTLLVGFLNAQENYNLQMRGNLPFPGRDLANIGGYVDSLGNEYALVGTSTGLSIVNVTDPDNPVMSFEVNGITSIWREVKTWQGFAYVTTEGTDGGLTVIDLRNLPNSIDSQIYRGDGAIQNQLSTSHALHIDNGYLYLYGANIGVGGVLFLNLADPWNPTYEGIYDQNYVHDGYVSGDTVWASQIYAGDLTVIDASDKSNPVVIGVQTTPGNFTHNSWLTDNHDVVLTTDEVENSYLASYDITDLTNITELDRYQTAPGSNCIVHNTHILNDYAVTSWYTEGVVIVDANHPANLIEVAKYDFTTFEGGTFNGCWGVYPFLPSGNLVASDMEGGLYILTPTYKRACYLEGIVRDSACGSLLEGVTVCIVEANINEVSGVDGTYRTGTVNAGIYTIVFSKPGYISQTFNNVNLVNGELTSFEVNLSSPNSFALNGSVSTNAGSPIESALISISDPSTSTQLSSNNLGEYAKCDLIAGNYQFVVGKWGYITNCNPSVPLNSNSASIETTLNPGYYDDFQFNFGWTVTSTSSAGFFERALPAATNFNGVASNPGIDQDADCNGFAYVSGNAAGEAGADDIDNGYTRLTSPIMDLSTYSNPNIFFSRWFFNGGGNGAINDTLFIQLSNNGEAPITIKKIVQDANSSQWIEESIQVKNYFNQPGQVRFIAQAQDFPNGHIVEAGIDRFYVTDSATLGLPNNLVNTNTLHVFPNPVNDRLNFQWKISDIASSISLEILDISGRIINSQILSNIEGKIQIAVDFPAGVYFVRLNANNRTLKTDRFVVAN
jgi:choice-of-anchor B domain-containing protein